MRGAEQQGREEQSWALPALQWGSRSRLPRRRWREAGGQPAGRGTTTRAAGPPPALPASSPPWRTPPRAARGAPEGGRRQALRWPLPAFPAKPAPCFPRQTQWAEVLTAGLGSREDPGSRRGTTPTRAPLLRSRSHWAVCSEHPLCTKSPPWACTRSRPKEPSTWPPSQRSGAPRADVREAWAKGGSALAQGKAVGPLP